MSKELTFDLTNAFTSIPKDASIESAVLRIGLMEDLMSDNSVCECGHGFISHGDNGCIHCECSNSIIVMKLIAERDDLQKRYDQLLDCYAEDETILDNGSVGVSIKQLVDKRAEAEQERDNLRKQLDVAISGINEIIDINLPFYVTDIAKKTRAKIEELETK